MNKTDKKRKKRSKTLMLVLAICLMSGSILVYVDYQFGGNVTYATVDKSISWE